MASNPQLRQVYTQWLVEKAAQDPRLFVVEADLMGASGTKPFREAYPERFVDTGVAEANMMGVAAGLANMGKIPFAHSFTPFATRRAFDQVTISIAYADLNVKIGGTDPGVTAELNGGTHMSFEDAGLMRGLANMIVVEPADQVQLLALLPQVFEHEGPVYMRLHRKNTEVFVDEGMPFTLGKIATLRAGTDVTLVCSGLMIPGTLEAARILAGKGISARVLNMHTLKPVDETTLVEAARQTGAMVTVENHSVLNGWGSAVCETLAAFCPVPVLRIGVQDHFGEVGSTDFLLEKYHMTPPYIVEAAQQAIALKAKR
ncbi:MAG TPA: transketolase C-terminal domain-containing protein [Thermotogota bacterium]|nr:transketolase C-terminal domain-containing protein [Thermotogota bacterium]HRW92927.1 transketolase C-terminal domain-containing protein [Thermotogota bacterium]